MSKYRTIIDPATNMRSILDTETNGWIPEDELNPDYREYLAWLAEGNEPQEWTPEEID